jgi:hypothetical protein
VNFLRISGVLTGDPVETSDARSRIYGRAILNIGGDSAVAVYAMNAESTAKMMQFRSGDQVAIFGRLLVRTSGDLEILVDNITANRRLQSFTATRPKK